MYRSTPHRCRPTHRNTPRVATICVVDPQPDQQAEWLSATEAGSVQIHFAASAAEALRTARTTAVDLWVIDADLSGLSGYELCGMLRNRNPRTPVYLVADEYSPEAERAAWAARATMFACKASRMALLEQWLRR